MALSWYDHTFRPPCKREPNLMFGSKCVGFYSMNKLQTYLPNASKMTYYKPPYNENVCFDLNKGMEWTVTRDYAHEDPRLLFKWIAFNHFMISAPPESNRWIEPHFVCASEVLTTLLCSSSPTDAWALRAAKFNGTIYLTMCYGKFAHYFSSQSEEESERFPSWEYKFERYVVSEKADQPPNPYKPVIEPDEFRCVYTTRFGDLTVLYDAPMKAVCSKTEVSYPLSKEELNFALLRLVKQMTYDPEQSLTVDELAKWWAIGHLTNNDEVLCGFRNEAGVVTLAKTYSIREVVDSIKFDPIHRLGENSVQILDAMSVVMGEVSLPLKYTWKPLPRLNYCRWVLSRIANAMISEEKVYEFEKIPHQPEITMITLPLSERNTVIPDNFTK